MIIIKAIKPGTEVVLEGNILGKITGLMIGDSFDIRYEVSYMVEGELKVIASPRFMFEVKGPKKGLAVGFVNG